MTLHELDFPYEQIRDPNGDLFNNWLDAQQAGYDDDQIWSIIEGEDNTWTYGPPHHVVNVLGFIATVERHDGETYYEEVF